MFELVVKRIQIFLEAVPGISEIAYLVNDNPAVVRGWELAKAAAPRLGVKIRRFDVNPRQPADLEKAIATSANQGLGGMVVPADNPFVEQRDLIGAVAARTGRRGWRPIPNWWRRGR